jgi:hypothetical protein
VFRKQFSEVEDACALAQAMVDTVREPLIVLDKDLRVPSSACSWKKLYPVKVRWLNTKSSMTFSASDDV